MACDKPDEMERERNTIGKKAGMVGIACNIFLAVIKLMAGVFSSSVSIIADALNNFTDATSSVVTLAGFGLSELPADDEHPYGHARFEYLSALVVAMLILVIGFEMALSAGEKILKPEAIHYNLFSVAILLASILLKACLSLYYKRKAELIGSSVLRASSVDSRNDVIATTAVLAAMLAEHFLKWQIDGYMGLAVAVFILYSGVVMAKETISPLLGEGANEELRETIESFILSNEKVVGCHDLMVHDYGPGKRFASIHVEIDKDEDAMLCHELLDCLERECVRRYGVNLVIHHDPVVTDDPELIRLHQIVSSS